MRDLSQQAGDALLSYQVNIEEDESLMHIVDVDIKGDETNMLICFKDCKLARLNLKTREFILLPNASYISAFDGHVSQLFIQATFIKSLPGNAFFIYTRAGNCYAFDDQM